MSSDSDSESDQDFDKEEEKLLKEEEKLLQFIALKQQAEEVGGYSYG